MSTNPIVSVIIPVYNTAEFLENSLQCIQNQTLKDIEILCLDDGSTDDSLSILKRIAETDMRVVPISLEHTNAGKARNYGIELAKGKYLYFFDSDDRCALDLLEKTVQIAEETGSDIVAFNFQRFYTDGTVRDAVGIHDNWIEGQLDVFNYLNCSSRIMSIINPTPWNKLYRASFVKEGNYRFEEITSTNDITFSAVTAAAANKISFTKEKLFFYRVGHGGTITATKAKNLNNVTRAVTSALEQVKKLPYYNVIQDAAIRFSVDNYVFSFSHYIQDIEDESAISFYNHIHTYFNEITLSDDVKKTMDRRTLRYFEVIKNNNYETIKELLNKKVIVSLTTFPKRIHSVHVVIDTLLNQSKKADEIILWLAEEEFPNREADLSDELKELCKSNLLKIGWCNNLKPHKKYLYAMKQNPDAIIITFDDDLKYEPNIIENLYLSYLEYPNAVSSARVHLMLADENGEFLPYDLWPKEVNYLQNEPNMQLCATGGAGALYPPHIFDAKLLDEELIMDLCPTADDLWMKVMELLCDIPVVLAQPCIKLKYVDNSQEESLFQENVGLSMNDVQMQKMKKWADETYYPNILFERLGKTVAKTSLFGISGLAKVYHASLEEKDNVIHRAWADKSDINARLKDTRERLQIAWDQKSEINAKLQKTYHEKAERGVQIKELNEEMKAIKNELYALKKNRIVRIVSKFDKNNKGKNA